MAISFHSADAPIPIRNRRKLKSFIEVIFSQAQMPVKEISYIFCSDAFLLDINLRFLQHDTYTDIITFPLSAEGEPLEAEIYISVDRVRDNASHLKEPFNTEIHRVIFHGALHLCGYKDKSKAAARLMRQMEDHNLQLWRSVCFT